MAYTSIDDPELYFQVKLYTGTGSSQALTFDGEEDMQPDFVWIKERDDTSAHNSYDSVRGVTKYIYVDENGGEVTDAGSLTAFGSNGFTVNNDPYINESSSTYVSYCWKGGTTSGIDTTGAEITPSGYSFNQTSGFSIVAYTGTGTDNDGVAHGLNAAPSFVISKKRSGTGAWVVKTCADKIFSSNDNHLRLDETAVLSGSNSTGDNTTSTNGATATTFNVGSWSGVNEDDGTFIAYCFAPKQGFSAFGSFEGNSSTNGPFIYTGFKPAMILYKNADYLENWHIQSWKQETANPNNNQLTPNENYAESSDSNTNVDFLSNGFKMRSSHRTSNYTGNTFVYMAFAEAPFVNSNGVPCNAR